jgi:hypothetical protein
MLDTIAKSTPPLDLRFLIREPADVYHARSPEHLTAHQLADFRRCPLLYRKKQLGLVVDRDTTAYLVGRAAHVRILEGQKRYEAEFAVGGPVNPKTGRPFGSGTKAFAEWAEKLGKPALGDDQAALVEQMAASVKAHPVAAELLADGLAEGVVRCQLNGQPCQARIDWINPRPEGGIVDLKTTDSLDGFEPDISAYCYVDQMAFYRRLVAEVAGLVLPVHLIGVEKREPFRCGVWKIAPLLLDAAQVTNDRAMKELARCRETGIWPTRFESMRVYGNV